MSTRRPRQQHDLSDLERSLGKMTLGGFIRAFREAECTSQSEYARRLGISRANLCDIEKNRKPVAPLRAARLARRIGVPESVLVQLALQDALRAAKLDYRIELKAG